MSLSEYCMDDYEVYLEVFHKHSICVADMMRILDNSISLETGMVVGRPKDLFRMVMDMLYGVDQSYKKVKNIKRDDEDYLFHYSFRDDAKEEMKTLLREEIERYFGTKGES